MYDYIRVYCKYLYISSYITYIITYVALLLEIKKQPRQVGESLQADGVNSSGPARRTIRRVVIGYNI